MSNNKNQPMCTTLSPDLVARSHLLVGQGAGGEALLRLLGQMPEEADLHVLYATEPSFEKDWSEQLRASCPVNLRILPSQAETLVDLDRTLSDCVMGTRLYITGSESFIGSAVQVAIKYNLNSDEMQCHLSGSAARRVYCIHCRESNENVTTNIVKCRGCGRHLFVRDHYSRRLAAYMGFMIDAEAPGEMPPIEENYV